MRTTNPITVSATQVNLHYDQSLASSLRPSVSQFTVTVGGQTVTPNGTSISGSEFRVFVRFDIAPDEAVTIAYSEPTPAAGNQPIQNSSGEEADSFSAKTATNNKIWSATALDAAASETSIAGHVVALRFTATLDSSPPFSVPASAFTVTVDGTAQTPGANQYVASSGANSKGLIPLQTLPTAIKCGQTVQVSYAPPLGATHFVSRNRLWGSHDKLVQRFTTQTITNNAALVANTGLGDSTTENFSAGHARAFTTGSRDIRLAAAGLTVSKQAGRGEAFYKVHVHASGDSGLPDDSLGELTKPTVLAQGVPDHTRHTVPTAVGEEIDLAADTTCSVVLDTIGALNTATSLFSTTGAGDLGANATTGWSIADSALVRGHAATTWGAHDDDGEISVHGAPVAPPLASAAANGTALTLTFNADLAAGSVPAASALTVRNSPGAELPAPLRSSGGLHAASSRSL